jgi:hypothetical protein
MLGRFLAFVSEYCYDPSTAQADINDFIAFAREHDRKASGTISAPYWSARTRKFYDPEKRSTWTRVKSTGCWSREATRRRARGVRQAVARRRCSRGSHRQVRTLVESIERFERHAAGRSRPHFLR